MVFFMVAHITFLMVLAFFVWFAAQRAEGLLSVFGWLLGAWIFLLGVTLIVGIFEPGFRLANWDHGGAMRGHWMHPFDQRDGAPSQPPPAQNP